MGAISAPHTRYQFCDHVHFIPQRIEHFLGNTSKTDTLEVIGGYVYTDQVTEADLKLN